MTKSSNISVLVFTLILLFTTLSGCKEDDTPMPEPTPDPKPVAAFHMTKTEALVDEVIQFTNASQHATSFIWDFGDGNTSSEANPEHTYGDAGNYTVKLKAKGAGGEDESTQTIKIAYPAPQASFSMNKTTAEVGEEITFTNTSQNAESFSWDFGDGSTTTQENPTHSFSSKGSYTITLTVTGAGGSSTTSKTIEITTLPLTGKWTGSGSNASNTVNVTYQLKEENGKISGTITVFRIQPGSISNLPYSTSGTFNSSTNEIEFETTSGFNFKYEYTGTYDGANKIVGKLKATNLSEIQLNLEREE